MVKRKQKHLFLNRSFAAWFEKEDIKRPVLIRNAQAVVISSSLCSNVIIIIHYCVKGKMETLDSIKDKFSNIT